MEIQIAGSTEERNIMMPLLYIDSHREKSNVEVIIIRIMFIELNKINIERLPWFKLSSKHN